MRYWMTKLLLLALAAITSLYWLLIPKHASQPLEVATAAVSEKVVIEQFETLGSLSNAEVAEHGKLKVEYSLPQRFLKRLQIGQRVHVYFDASLDHHYEADVSFIAPVVDQATGTIAVEAILKPSQKLPTGLFVRVSHELAKEKKRLFIPDEGLITHYGQQRVFVLRNGHAQAVHVHTGAHYHAMTEISQGLKAGDIVIISRQNELTDDAVVIEHRSDAS